MKYRVIEEKGLFYPQCKRFWFSSWKYIFDDVEGYQPRLCYTNAENAILFCELLVKDNTPKVVWESD